MNITLDDEIKKEISQLSDTILIIDDWHAIADELSNSFEWRGSKINWSKTTGHKSLALQGNYSEWSNQINKFIVINNINTIILSSGNIYYINDSSLNFAVGIKPCCFFHFFEMAINNIPQHHYFFSKKNRWCMVISSEGYFDFGFSKTNTVTEP